MGLSGQQDERASRFDPLVVVCCLVAGAVYVLHGFDGPLTRDPGVYSYGGQLVAAGVPPYAGIFNRAGPLATLIPGIGVVAARATGIDDILGMRILFLLISVACVGLAYLAGRELFRSRLAGLATAGALLSFHGFIQYASYGPREKTAMVLFLLATLLAITGRRWWWTGFFIALATLTWQPVFFVGLAAAVAAVLVGEPRGGRLRALLGVTVGGLVPTAVTVAAYAVVGDLRLFMDDFLLVNARYTSQSGFVTDVSTSWHNLAVGYGASLWLLLGGLVVLPVIAFVRLLRKSDRRDPRTGAVVGAAVATVVGFVWSLRAFNDWPDAFVLLPVAALGVGGVIGALAERTSRRTVVAATAILASISIVIALTYSIGRRDDRLTHQRESVATALRVLPHAHIMSIEAPQPLVLAHQRNGSLYQLFGNGTTNYLDKTWPGGITGYARWVARQAPMFIAVGDLPPEWLTVILDQSYRRVGRAPGWVWYLRIGVGHQTFRTLREAFRSQSWRVKA
jgi:hypothetical protein